MIPLNYIQRVMQFARQGFTEIDFKTYDTDWDSDAYLTVSGQNSNNSVRVSDEFLRTVEADGEWNLIRRIDGKVAQRSEEHTSELPSLMRISYAVFCMKQTNNTR